MDNNIQQIAKPQGEKGEIEKKDSAQPVDNGAGQNMALEAPDVNDKLEEQKPAQALEPPDADVMDQGLQGGQDEGAVGVGAAPMVHEMRNGKEDGAVINNLDENGNGADVADLPVHRGVKEDPANAMVAGNNHDNNGDNMDEGLALADNDAADNGAV